jgi:sigma-B regulation protein RsbU (phosphoserine phosphatase)
MTDNAGAMKDRIPVRTLVIDDDESVCRRVSGWLEAEAYEVAAFTDPRAGLEHAARDTCDLALVDLRLPDADGVEVIARLGEVSPRTRVVAMSAFPQAEQVRRAVRAGARDLIEKPVSQPALLQVLQRQLAEIGIPVRTETEFNRRLGSRLRRLRREAHRTQRELAASVGITPAQLSQIELGKTATTTWTLARIGGALKVPLPALFEDA